MHNRARPEGSNAKGYLMEECMHFYSIYLTDVETKSDRASSNNDGGDVFGHLIRKGLQIPLDKITLEQSHRYVMHNIDKVAPFKM